MDINILHLAYPLGLGIAVIGSGFGLGKAVSAAMEAIGRQPEAAGRIQTAMIIGCAFIEALTIYALISVFLVSGFGWKPAAEAAGAKPAAEQTQTKGAGGGAPTQNL
ncbi:MAG: ATP synthase F0 subunit C [Candidatus Sumerlaeota bacterium]|nr:ATP synthase F0 subunit C [Candidatus Sumerlaeota bacterium]